jgi:hypothetical protein
MGACAVSGRQLADDAELELDTDDVLLKLELLA